MILFYVCNFIIIIIWYNEIYYVALRTHLKIIDMKNLKIAQQYPNSKNNTVTLKHCFIQKIHNTLIGDHLIVLNGNTIKTQKVDSDESLKLIKDKYNVLCEDLGLTFIDESEFSIVRY